MGDFATVRDALEEAYPDRSDCSHPALDRIQAVSEERAQDVRLWKERHDRIQAERDRLREALHQISDNWTRGNAGNTASAAESWYAAIARRALEGSE